MLGALQNPGELWDTLNRETLRAAEECTGKRRRSKSFVATEATQENNYGRERAARLAVDSVGIGPSHEGLGLL